MRGAFRKRVPESPSAHGDSVRGRPALRLIIGCDVASLRGPMGRMVTRSVCDRSQWLRVTWQCHHLLPSLVPTQHAVA